MNKLFILLRLINYLSIVVWMHQIHLPLHPYQIGITAAVCCWGIWDYWKKPDEPIRQMRKGVWIEMAAVTVWLMLVPDIAILFAFISPLARAGIHLPSFNRWYVFAYLWVISALASFLESINSIWIVLLVYSLILVYTTVLSMWFKERDHSKKLLALSAFERERQARDQERIRLSRQLHDTMGQHWTSVIRALDVAVLADKADLKQEFSLKAKEAALLGLESMRKTMKVWNDGQNSPDRWIAYAFQSLDRIQDLTNVTIEHRTSSIDWERLKHSQHITESLARTMIEGVTNAIRHGNASHIEISVKHQAERLHLRVKDDGVGFDIKEREHGMGLKSLDSLAKEYDGDLQVISSPGQGTSLNLTIPCSLNGGTS